MLKKRKDLFRRIKMKDSSSTIEAGFWIKHNFDTVCSTDPNALKEGYPNCIILARLTNDQMKRFEEKFANNIKDIHTMNY